MCVDCVGPTIILGGYQNTTGSANGRYFETRFCEGFFNYFFYLEFFRDVRFCWFRSFRGGWRWESRKKDPGIKPRPITGYYWGFSPSGLRIWLRKTFGSGTGWKRMHKKTEKPFTGHFLKTFSIEIWNNYYLRSKAGFFSAHVRTNSLYKPANYCIHTNCYIVEHILQHTGVGSPTLSHSTCHGGQKSQRCKSIGKNCETIFMLASTCLSKSKLFFKILLIIHKSRHLLRIKWVLNVNLDLPEPWTPEHYFLFSQNFAKIWWEKTR